MINAANPEVFSNIFEVVKTIQFELKPSKFTKKRLPKAEWSDEYLSDTRKFFEKAREAIQKTDAVLARFQAGEAAGIEVGKDFLRHLDHVRFERKKQESSWSLRLQKALNAEWGLWFQTAFDEKITSLREGFAKAMDRDLTVITSEFVNQTKADEIRAMKRVALALKRADLFLSGGSPDSSLHEIRPVVGNDVADYLRKWQSYRKIEDDFFRSCHSAYRSTKANGEIEWTKAGLNPRSLHKKADLDTIRQSINRVSADFEKFSVQKREWAARISQWNEDHSREKTIEEERLGKQGFKGTKLSNELERWREKRNDGYVIDNSGNRLRTLKSEKIFASKKAGEAKQKLQAFEEEIFRQESVDHFGLLLRKGENYFLAMIDKDAKDALQTIPGVWSGAEALVYRSLTFKALAKQAEKQRDFDKRLFEKCRFFQKKDVRMQPTQEEMCQYVGYLAKVLERINATNDNGFSWDAAEMEKIVSRGDIDAFRVFVNENCYRKEWRPTDWDTVSAMDVRGEIFLFQLSSQDFALDPDFAITERDLNRTKKSRKDAEKQNLHTRYWLDCFERELRHSHCGPELRVYLRPKKSESDLRGVLDVDGKGKSRFREEKVIADFQIIFYPERKLSLVDANRDILKRLADTGVKAFIGIDRGENSLANYFVIGIDGKILLDESGNPIKGDMTFRNTLGEFVNPENVFDGNGKYKRISLSDELKGKYGIPMIKEEDGRDTKKPAWDDTSITLSTLLKLRNALENELHPKSLVLTDARRPDGNPNDRNANGMPRPVRVYDHRYAFDHARLLQRVIYEMWMKKEMQSFVEMNQTDEEIEKSKYVSQLLSTRELRGGYVGTFVHTISGLLEKYSAIVVFEDLNASYERNGNEENFLSWISETNLSPKEKNVLKGVSVYQMLEEQLIRKLNYHVVKTSDDSGKQLAPKIPNLSLLRNIPDEELKKDDVRELRGLGMDKRIWSVQYVNEAETSKTCPDCWFAPSLAKNAKVNVAGDALSISFEYEGKKHAIDGTSPYVNESKEQRKRLWKKLVAIESIADGTLLADISYKKDGTWSFGGLFNVRDKSKDVDRVMCPCCGFDTDAHPHIKSGDELAAYTIAVRWKSEFAKPLPIAPEMSQDSRLPANSDDRYERMSYNRSETPSKPLPKRKMHVDDEDCGHGGGYSPFANLGDIVKNCGR